MSELGSGGTYPLDLSTYIWCHCKVPRDPYLPHGQPEEVLVKPQKHVVPSLGFMTALGGPEEGWKGVQDMQHVK